MQNCANCGHQNRPGVVYCENCAASLLGEKPLSTKSIGSSSEEEKAQMKKRMEEMMSQRESKGGRGGGGMGGDRGG